MIRFIVYITIFLMTGLSSIAAYSDRSPDVMTGFDSPTGILSGFVKESSSGSSIPGTHISIIDIETGGVTSPDGTFEIHDVPAGVYSVHISHVGYRARTLTNVVIRGNRTTRLTVELIEDVVEGGELVISGGYFHINETGNVSRTTLNAEEIRRSPGGGQELTRVIMATPGVASNGDMSQDLMVRGGSPRENAYYINHIFVPGIQHFEEMNGSSNGPIGLINTDLVEHLEFYAGGFSASHGGRMSSMTDIHYREASRENVQGSINMNMAGFGGSLETPIADGKGSWLISARRSYLDLLADAIDIGGAPRYGDIQIKGDYDINSRNRITFLQIYGDSRFTHPIEDALDEGFLSSPDYKNDQNTTGLNWRRFWNDHHFSNTSVSYSFTRQNLLTRFVEDESTDVRFNNRHDYLNFRNMNYWRATEAYRFEYGLDMTYIRGSFDYFYSSYTNEAGFERPEFMRKLVKDQFGGAVYGTLIYKPVAGVTINTGGRTEYNSINSRLSISPRFSVSWEVTNRLTMNTAAGIYRQNLPLYIRSQQPEFDDLKDPYAVHLIGGFDYLLGEATMLRMEIYDKQYRNMPVQAETYSDGFPGFVFESQDFFDQVNDVGIAYARGVDIMLQRKIKEGVYGLVSTSLFRSRYRDHQGEWQRRDFDVKHLISIIGGYRPDNKWEFSARWTYIGNRPATPLDMEQSGNMNQTIRDGARFNKDSLPAFHSLYLRLNRRFFMHRMTMVTFMEFWNTYNRNNVHSIYWDRNKQQPAEESYFNFMPVGGFLLEF